MKAARHLLAVLLAAGGHAAAADTIFLENGSLRTGRIAGFDGTTCVLEVTMPPPRGAEGMPPIVAKVTIPRSEIRAVEFAADRALERALADGASAELAALWAKWKSWLRVPRSPTPRVAIAYGRALLAAGGEASAQAALELFDGIETTAWNEEARAQAKQGRLRAMIALGRAGEAVAEAAELAKLSEDPAVLIEANDIRARAADRALRKLVEDNPRWEEDIHVLPERQRLHDEALDLYLHPALFLGSESAAAARGLWGAAGIHRFTGNLAEARELARDIEVLYPETPEAAEARAFLASLPENLRSENPEKQ